MGYAVQKAAPIWGTWVPTFAGFSADPTMTCRYIVFGKTCWFWITTTAHGTSNSTSASGTTITLPFTSANITTQNAVAARITDNGANQSAPGLCLIASNSNVCTVYRNGSLTTAWTGSGNKSFSLVGQYEIA